MSVSVFPDEIGIWISGLSKADHPTQCGWASSNPLKSWIETYAEEEGILPFFPASLIKLGYHILPSPPLALGFTSLTALALTPSYLDWLNYTSGFLGSPAGRWQTVGLTGLHYCMSQLLIITPFLSIYFIYLSSIYWYRYLHPTGSVVWRTLTYAGGYPF